MLNAIFEPSIQTETVAATDIFYGGTANDRFYKGPEDVVQDFGNGADLVL